MSFQLSDISKIFTFNSESKYEKDNNTFKIVKYINEDSIDKGEYIIGYINSIMDTGCYIIMINCDINEGPNGVFCLSRSDKQKEGDINTLVSSEGKNKDKIILKWNSYEKPSIILKRNKSKISIINNNLYGNKSKNLKIVFNIKVIY
jgi:hypothetical protein